MSHDKNSNRRGFSVRTNFVEENWQKDAWLPFLFDSSLILALFLLMQHEHNYPIVPDKPEKSKRKVKICQSLPYG